MSNIKIAPSILAADFTRLGEEIGAVLKGGAEYIHVDVMDGRFVPNISIGVPVVQSIRKSFPDAFLDVHLMIDKPIRYVETFCRAGASHLTFHVEADAPENITAALEKTRAMGVRTGLSVKPGTAAAALEPWLEALDMVLVMTVEPGFGGQKFMADMMPKVTQLRRMLDGANPGCDLVAGSAVFGREDYAAVIRSLRGR